MVINCKNMHDRLENNAFNRYHNPSSIFYEGNQNIGSGFYFNDDKTHRKSKPFTKKERKVIKRTVIIVLLITATISLLLGWEKGLYFGFSAFVYLLIFALMPYVFLREIVDSIKAKRKNKKHKQLELPL